MPYQSPIYILAHFESGVTDLTPQGIRRLQQKIMAEFALDNKQTLLINKHSYSKDDLLKTIDRLKEENYADIQQKLFGNKLGLSFLENEEEHYATHFVNPFFDSLKSEPGFHFLQEPICTALSRQLKINIPLYQFNYCAACLGLINLLTSDQQQDVYNQIVAPLQEYIDNLKYEAILMNKQLMEMPYLEDVELINYIKPSVISNPISLLFNQLPAQFDGLKTDYVLACLDFIRQWQTLVSEKREYINRSVTNLNNIKQGLATENKMRKLIDQFVTDLQKITDLDTKLKDKIDSYHSSYTNSTSLVEGFQELSRTYNQTLAAHRKTIQQAPEDENEINPGGIFIKVFMGVLVVIGMNIDSAALTLIPAILLLIIVRREQIKKAERK